MYLHTLYTADTERNQRENNALLKPSPQVSAPLFKGKVESGGIPCRLKSNQAVSICLYGKIAANALHTFIGLLKVHCVCITIQQLHPDT